MEQRVAQQSYFGGLYQTKGEMEHGLLITTAIGLMLGTGRIRPVTERSAKK